MEMTPKLRQAVKDYKAGKTDSFTMLYEESNKYIYTCIYKVLSGNDNAQELTYDMMQDTYVEISRSLAQLEDEERFLSWAGTIARRKCYAYIKKNKKYVLLNEEDDTFENLSDSDEIIPEEVMQSREKQRLIREIIDTQLTEMQKLCIMAYYYNEQKQSEIAEELGIPENTVKTNLSRAKAKIRDGVLDLEKNKGTKLYSAAPLFLLLFEEDIMATVVPQEIGARVVASVTEAGATAVETGVSASAASEATGGAATGTATTGGTVSTGATASTVATKAGVLGKIAAASVKAKILMAVATVSVVGAVGGGVVVASQNGLFSNAPTVNETQETENGQEASEELLVTETENETETISTEESELPEIEYSMSFQSASGEIMRFNIDLPLGQMEDRSSDSILVKRTIEELEGGMSHRFYIKMGPRGSKANWLDLDALSDADFISRVERPSENSNAHVERIKTDTYHIVYIWYDAKVDGQPMGGCEGYIYDYVNDKGYLVYLYESIDFYSEANFRHILDSLEIEGIKK